MEEINTSGFYKNDEAGLLYAPNKVINQSFELDVTRKDEYVYPIDGWYFFDSEEDAILSFDIKNVR